MKKWLISLFLTLIASSVFAVAWVPAFLDATLHGIIAFGLYYSHAETKTKNSNNGDKETVVWIQTSQNQPFNTADIQTSATNQTQETAPPSGGYKFMPSRNLPNSSDSSSSTFPKTAGYAYYSWVITCSTCTATKNACYGKTIAQCAINLGQSMPEQWHWTGTPGSSGLSALASSNATYFSQNDTWNGWATTAVSCAEGWAYSEMQGLCVRTGPWVCDNPLHTLDQVSGKCYPAAGLDDGFCRMPLNPDGTYTHNPFDIDCTAPTIQKDDGSATEPASVTVTTPDGGKAWVKTNKPTQANPNAGSAGVSTPTPQGSTTTTIDRDGTGKVTGQNNGASPNPPSSPTPPGGGSVPGGDYPTVNVFGNCGGPNQPACKVDTGTKGGLDSDVEAGDDVADNESNINPANADYFDSFLNFKAFSYTPATVTCSQAFSVTDTDTSVSLSSGETLDFHFDPRDACPIIEPWEQTIQEVSNALWYIAAIILIIRLTI